ncbi:hypothetical protein NDU88_004316 [Pleurodeles waltl]|uniref:Uncharacterized protein n=1 Tax=Pleurodeles waltl TaxID=8319 RepID=A0AAV7W8N3_PLEWA|nr:hypothetical protein NDU88_004316 [Pleurodeles waltl]
MGSPAAETVGAVAGTRRFLVCGLVTIFHKGIKYFKPTHLQIVPTEIGDEVKGQPPHRHLPSGPFGRLPAASSRLPYRRTLWEVSSVDSCFLFPDPARLSDGKVWHLSRLAKCKNESDLSRLAKCKKESEGGRLRNYKWMDDPYVENIIGGEVESQEARTENEHEENIIG